MVEIGVPQPPEQKLENAEWYWGDITRLVLWAYSVYFALLLHHCTVIHKMVHFFIVGTICNLFIEVLT